MFCSSARNGPAVVSNMLPETHFKGTSYCELVKGRLEGRPNISDIKYFPPPQTENYVTLSPFTTSSISTHFISYESLLESEVSYELPYESLLLESEVVI